MTFEVAVIPKEARIAALERSLAEKIDTLHELRHQKSEYLSELSDAKRSVAEMEIELASFHSSLQEKDSVIQMMQKSFLEPEEDSFSSKPYPLSPLSRSIPPLPPASRHDPSVLPPSHHPPPYDTRNGRPYHPPPPGTQQPPSSSSSSTTTSTPPSSSYHRHQTLPPSPQYPIPPPHLPLPPKPFYAPSLTSPESAAPQRGSNSSSGSYVELMAYSTRPRSASIQPRSTNGTVRSPLASPAVNQANRALPPTKMPGGVKPRGVSSNHGTKYPLDEPKKKNGYTHTSTLVGKYTPGPSLLQHQHGSYSNSAPNSPNVQTTPRKPRISYPNLRLLQVPAPKEYIGGFNRQSHAPTNNIRRKSNTNPGGMRRSNFKPLPSPREVKSKTPPPDYRLVSVSSGRGNNSGKLDPPKVVQTKQRHRSVEDMLSTDLERMPPLSSPSGSKVGGFPQQDAAPPPPAPPPHHYPSTSSLELFESLVGGDNPFSSSSSTAGSGHARSAHSLNRTPPQCHHGNSSGHRGLVSSLQLGGSSSMGYHGDLLMHQHSKSSPTNNDRIIHH